MKRQIIIDNLKIALERIAKHKGFNFYHDVKTVDVWRKIPFNDDDMPAINIEDSTCNIEALASNYNKIHKRLLDVTLKGVVLGDDTDGDARKLISDIYLAISIDPTWGGQAIRTIPISDEIDFEHSDNKHGSILIKIQILYHTKGWEEI